METVNSWVWLGTVGMALGTFVLLLLGSTLRKEDRTHVGLAVGITAIASTAYFAMTSGFGDIDVAGTTVQSARYIDWLITTPLLLLSLGLLALPSGMRDRAWTLVTLLGLDVYMIVTGFLATLADPDTKWVWYSLSCVAFVLILYMLFGRLMSAVKDSGSVKLSKLYSVLAVYLSVLWVAYPVLWLLGSTGQASLDFVTENSYYTILDLLAKVGFGLLVVWNLKKLSETVKAKEGESTIDALSK
jgi:bacteriorhodopsin